MEHSTRRLWYFGLLALLVILGLAVIWLSRQGYGISLRGITAPGIISLDTTGLPAGVALAVDGSIVMPTMNPDGTASVVVPAGSRHITLTRDGYWTWEKTIDLDSRDSLHVRPFTLPTATEGNVIKPGDPAYNEAAYALAVRTTPDPLGPAISQDGTLELFKRDASIVARVHADAKAPDFFCFSENTCDKERTVLDIDAEVRGLDFLPGRSDVLLIAVQDGVFAVELDTRGSQNFQALYRGIRPSFVRVGDAIYIADGESIFTARLSREQ